MPTYGSNLACMVEGCTPKTVACLQAYNHRLPKPAPTLFARRLWLARQDLCISACLVDVEVVAVEFHGTYVYAVISGAIHVVLRKIGYKYRIMAHYRIVFVGFLQNSPSGAYCIALYYHNGVIADNLCWRRIVLRPSRGKTKQPHQ